MTIHSPPDGHTFLSISSGSGVLSRISDTSDGALINLGENNSVLIENVSKDDLDASMFVVSDII